MAEAAEEAADAFTADGAEDYATTDLTECDLCFHDYPSDQMSVRWCGAYEAWVCATCIDSPPSVDRRIAEMRGK